jgi:hypothetical protein
MDVAGNISVASSERSAATTNTTTPKAPLNLTTTNNRIGSVRLAWNAVTQNTSNVSGDPQSPTIRDLGGYRVYRSTASGGPYTRIADESAIGPLGTPLYLDITAVNCRPYYYNVTAADSPCGVESVATSNVAGNATSTTKPLAPSNAQAFVAGAGKTRVTWQAVVQDVDGNQISIDKYKVWRSHTSVIDGNDPLAASYDLLVTVTGALLYEDASPPTPPAGSHYWYRVSALDDCPNESALSSAAFAECAFSGTPSITAPTNGQAVAGVVTVTAAIIGGTDPYTKATFVFTHATLGVTLTQIVTGAGPTWSYDWFATPAGAYTITATVENSTGCTKSASISVTAGDIVGCCLSPTNPTQNPVSMACIPGSPNNDCTTVSYFMINNGCRTAVSIESMIVTWYDRVGNGARLRSVQFDGGTIWNLSPYSTSPATNPAFSAPKPQVALNRTSSNPVKVTYLFNSTTSDHYKDKGTTYYRRDDMTTTYGFRLLDSSGLPTSITGTCGPSQGMFGNLLVDQN